MIMVGIGEFLLVINIVVQGVRVGSLVWVAFPVRVVWVVWVELLAKKFPPELALA